MASDHCCVPLCTSDARKSNSLNFHRIPIDQTLRKLWLIAIRRDEGRFFTVTGKTCVCSLHFLPEDYKFTAVRKTLWPRAVPSQFAWTKTEAPRKSPAERLPLQPRVIDTNSDNPEPESYMDPPTRSGSTQTEPQPDQQTHTQDQQLLQRIRDLEAEQQRLESLLAVERFGIERFSTDPSLVQYYTSFCTYELFVAFYNYVHPTACNMRSMYYVCSDNLSLAGRPRGMLLIDEMFMFFVRLRLGTPEQDLAVRFNCHLSTVSRKIITWANFLYFVLGSFPIWPSRNQIDYYMPSEFKLLYPSTRVIIDCTEIKVQIPSALVLNSMFYSHYKSSCTLKGLIGIAPHGAVTFVSCLFTGVMSDVEITKISGILDLLEPGDSVMADKGFTIASILREKGVGLNIPPFLHNCCQFSCEEIEETQKISSLRIHVERLIRRIKQNQLFDSAVSLSELGTINQLWTVACIASGFQGPLKKKCVKPLMK